VWRRHDTLSDRLIAHLVSRNIRVEAVPLPDDIGKDVRTVRDAVVTLRKALAAPAPAA
jgi:hypothetical protein